MEKKYLSVHFLHNDNDDILNIKPKITSFDDLGFSQQENPNLFESTSHFLHDTYKETGLPASLSLEEEADITSFSLISEYANEPELHILQVRNPFSEVPDEFVMLTDDGEVITSVTSTFVEDEDALLEDNFMNNQIYDYSYGATTDFIPEVDKSILDDGYSFKESSELIYSVILNDDILSLISLGKKLSIENDLETESWTIYLDNKKFAELHISAEDCTLENNEFSFYDKKGNPAKANGFINLSDNKTIDFEDIASIHWYLI
jgi:hypothetical protein